MATSENPLSQDQKEELPSPQVPEHDGPQHFWLQSWFFSVRVCMGFPSRGLALLLETVPRDTVVRNHQINSTVNPPAAPMSLPSLTWRLGSQLFWLIKDFQSTYDLRPPSGDWRNRAAGASPHPAAVPCHLDAVAFSTQRERWHFMAGGPRGNRQDPPMKMRRARNRKALSLHYAAPSQHAGCLLILIGTTNNLVTSAILPIKARGMTLAGPGGRAKWEVVET